MEAARRPRNGRNRDIVVICGSAGALEPLRLGDHLVRAAQAGDAAVHVVFRIRHRAASAARRALMILGGTYRRLAVQEFLD